MGRLLILAALIGVVAWWLLGRVARVRRDDVARPDSATKSDRSTPAAVQDMVPCAHCGVHLPRTEAVAEGIDLYCSEAHRRLGRRS